jgi:hypothetical protein
LAREKARTQNVMDKKGCYKRLAETSHTQALLLSESIQNAVILAATTTAHYSRNPKGRSKNVKNNGSQEAAESDNGSDESKFG